MEETKLPPGLEFLREGVELRIHHGPERTESHRGLVVAIARSEIRVSGRWDRLPSLHRGAFVMASVADPRGLYCFDTEILAFQEVPVAAVKLAIPAMANRIQRRNFFRLEERFPVKLSYPDKLGPRTVSGTTFDISGGGLRASFQGIAEVPALPFEVGVELTLAPSEPPLAVQGMVLRTQRAPSGATIFSLKFANLRPADQDRICRHIFVRQAELARRARLEE